MLSVLLIYGVIFITTYWLGRGFLHAFRLTPSGADAILYSMTGIAVAGFYAQVWSIFGGVSAAAFVVYALLALAAAVVLFARGGRRTQADRVPARVCALNSGSAGRYAQVALTIALVMVFAYAASRGYIHYDTDLYHAQSIHWIEKYGAVRGLGNLHTRLGYNSAAFPLTALFSFSFLGGQSYHAVSGYLALMLALESFRLFTQRGRLLSFRLLPSDFVRLSALFYLFAVIDEIVSPASDYYMVCFAFYIFIRFSDDGKDEAQMADDAPLHLDIVLSFLAVFTVTIKLSAAMILLISLLPVAQLLRRKDFRRIAVTAILCAGSAAPFFIRNVILTGYLVYPFPKLDLFHVIWKVPAGLAASDAAEIAAYGKGITDPSHFGDSISVWLRPWFAAQAGADRLAILTGAVLVIPAAVVLLLEIRRREQGAARQLVLLGVCLACTVFWFAQAPLLRYGCVFVYTQAAFSAGVIVSAAGGKFQERRRRLLLRGFLVCSIVFVLYKCVAVTREGTLLREHGYLISQKDYGTYPMEEYRIDGAEFYRPVSGDRSGYAPFPSTPTDRSAQVRMIGESIGDGFCIK